ncbi:unnamed protein product, partial [Vitis vinifera]
MKLKRRRALEVPPKIRSFINGVTSTPLENIEEPLKCFIWEFDKGDFHHWVDLFNHFDSFFEKHIKPRKDLQVEDNFLESDPPFPREAVLQILRVIRIILENCTNKHFYSSYEQHLSALLASTDADVVEACLQTLAAFLKKSIGKYPIRDASLNSKLFAFAQGWGGKEEGLGLIACSVQDGCDQIAYDLGCTLHFDLRFSLLTRLRFARAFGSLAARQQYTCIRLYAFMVLVQSGSDADDLASFFTAVPEVTNELVSLLSYEDAIPIKIRILSLSSLAALCQDRSRQPSVLNAVTSGGHRGILPNTEPQHLHLVSTAVHILEAFMDYSNPAAALFRDLGGLDDTISRLKVEVSHPLYSEALVAYHCRLLMKALLRAISLGTYAPGSTTRIYGSEESLLPHCLCIIFRRAKDFGGGVFSLAATVMSDLIHKDPTCFPVLDAAGLPSAFMDAIMDGILCSAEAIACIPQCLDALCLNNNGLQAVKDRNALRCFVKIFTSRTYLRALTGDTPGSLSSGLDELMRHASSLRGPGVDMLIEILNAISKIGSGTESPPSSSDSISEQAMEPSSDASLANIESFLPECISNAARLLETILQNADTCRIFVEKKGIEAALSFSGYSSSNGLDLSLSVKCRYLGKVVDDIAVLTFDGRRRTCYTAMVNNFYVHGTFKELLTTFEATSQLLWTLPYSVPTQGIDNEKVGEGSKLSHTFVRMLQSQVLDVMLPVWNHPMFPSCSSTFITSIISLVTHIYSGVGDVKRNRNVEMGFTRARAEEALRRVETNSVELAMEWLFSRPEDPVQEDDELARALALSLGSSSETSKVDSIDKSMDILTEEGQTKAPPVDDILVASMKLFQSSDTMAFPLTDLLVTLCNRSKGEDRSKVVTYLIQQLKLCPLEFSKDASALYMISHILALLLFEDGSTREIAARNGIVSAAIDILMSFKARNELGNEVLVPKCISALLLILDNLLQSRSRFSSETTEGNAMQKTSWLLMPMRRNLIPPLRKY